MREVFIVGVGMTKFGVQPELSSAELARSAVKAALTDAHAAVADIDVSFYANTVGGAIEEQYGMKGQHALRAMGVQGGPLYNVENACAGGATAFNLAAAQVGAGLAEVALAVGTEKLNTDDREKRARSFGQPLDIAAMKVFLERIGPSVADVKPPPDVLIDPKMFSLFMEGYAIQAKAHMKKYGTTVRQIAAVAAKNHHHSIHSPLAQFQKDFSIEEILAAKVIAWPLTLPMCSPISDGAAAVVLCSKAALARFDGRRAVKVLASVLKGGTDRDFDDREKGCGRRAATAAYELAGIGPKDVDVAEVHDGSAYGEIAQLESCMLVPPGEGGPAAERGETRIGGRIPVNTAGGLESRGHPVAATGCAQLHELVLQLRGEAGKRQVEGARIALASTSGGFMGVEDGIASITLLGRA
ncbi:MAG: thiolase family protein [Gammaproteobacteria bacterium]|nr:thiolase family protein [Gammaproteobacteria bacterium]